MRRKAGTDTLPHRRGVQAESVVGGAGWQSRAYVTSAFNNYGWIRTAEHTLNVRFDGANPRLIGIRDDPGHEHNLAERQPDVVRELFECIRRDGGDDLPLYDRPTTFADGSAVPRR